LHCAVPGNGQQRAQSYQAEDLQEEEVVEEQDAGGEQRPPHVPQRLRLVHTCREKRFVRHVSPLKTLHFPLHQQVERPAAAERPATGSGVKLAFPVSSLLRAQPVLRHLMCPD